MLAALRRGLLPTAIGVGTAQLWGWPEHGLWRWSSVQGGGCGTEATGSTHSGAEQECRRRKRLPAGNGGWSTTVGYEESCRRERAKECSSRWTDGQRLEERRVARVLSWHGQPPSSKNQVRWDRDQPDRTLRQKGSGSRAGGCSCAAEAQPELCVGSEPKPKRAPSRHRWRLHVSQSGWCFANPASLCCAKKSRQLNSACSSMGNPVEIRAISP